MAHGTLCQHRHQGREDGHPRTRAILGNGACRHVDVHIRLLEYERIDAQIFRLPLDQCHGCLRTLLHDLAELAGQYELARAGDTATLDEQDVAADRSPGQARGHARHAGTHRNLVFVARRAQDGRQVGGTDGDRTGLAGSDGHRVVAQHRADLALEPAHAGLARVVADEATHRIVGELQLLGGEPIGG